MDGTNENQMQPITIDASAGTASARGGRVSAPPPTNGQTTMPMIGTGSSARAASHWS